ncbi:MAG TPA: YqiA/YcfP family alpha/beta fold hydrolase [Acidobacteriota bacterium]|nr:YqiA/YcfP family alpha/beta fold hydrolase [Acidobacteriota bacterium]HNT17214.1 YqiA/YcfP family alpha/beta fold hydrolase [Acidobacteriota bacterium]
MYHDIFTGEYAVAFAGVNQVRDVFQSMGQMAFGKSRQFTEALDEVTAVMQEYNTRPILVGHSLGGALAAVVAVQLGLKAYTFNAEGVNSSTVGREALARANDLVRNYWGGRCWLTAFQIMTPLPNAIGKQIYVGPVGHGIKGFPKDMPFVP